MSHLPPAEDPRPGIGDSENPVAASISSSPQPVPVPQPDIPAPVRPVGAFSVHHPAAASLPPKDDWIQTYTGRHVSPFHLTVDDLAIEDIAHALAHLCRFGGHARRFYSVGQHSLLVSGCCPPELVLWGLLHDAAEAYLGDVPRPIKKHLPFYREVEDRILRAVAERFGLVWPMPERVKAIDTAALGTEAQALMGSTDGWKDLRDAQPLVPAERLGELLAWSPAEAERRFLARYHELTG